jgi:hypothetical protein
MLGTMSSEAVRVYAALAATRLQEGRVVSRVHTLKGADA